MNIQGKELICSIHELDYRIACEECQEKATKFFKITRKMIAQSSEIARKGGEATLKKYGEKKMREWGKRGGRPKKAGESDL